MTVREWMMRLQFTKVGVYRICCMINHLEAGEETWCIYYSMFLDKVLYDTLYKELAHEVDDSVHTSFNCVLCDKLFPRIKEKGGCPCYHYSKKYIVNVMKQILENQIEQEGRNIM